MAKLIAEIINTVAKTAAAATTACQYILMLNKVVNNIIITPIKAIIHPIINFVKTTIIVYIIKKL